MTETADLTRTRAGQELTLGAEAINTYQAAGWHITAGGRVDLGAVVGPCAHCTQPTVLYGPHGQPLCPACRTIGVPA